MAELLSTFLYGTSSLISYYRMEGNSNDSKGSNNGTDTNITYNTTNGKFNQGAGTTGLTTSHISMSAPVVPIGAQSVVAWVKTTTSDNYRAFIDTTDGSSTNIGLTLAVSTAGKLYCDLDSSGRLASIEAGTINDGNFHHIAFTWDGTTGAGKVISYVDGNQAGTATASGTQSGSPSFNLTIGNYHSVANQGFNGAIDDVGIFNRSLTAGEVLMLFQTGGHFLTTLGAGA